VFYTKTQNMHYKAHYVSGLAMLLASIILFSTSCKKKAAIYELNGTISDPQLKVKVDNVKVSLKASKIESGVYNPNFVEIQSTKSSSSGSYSFSVEYDNVSAYRLDFNKTNYFDASKEISPEYLQSNSPLSVDINIIPIAEINLSVKNTSPQGTDDQITFRFKNIEVKCKDCWNNEPITGSGPSYNYNATKKLSGEKDVYIEWVVKKKGNQKIYQDTIHTKAFKSVNFNINY